MGQCVMTSGTMRMPLWSADNWDSPPMVSGVMKGRLYVHRNDREWTCVTFQKAYAHNNMPVCICKKLCSHVSCAGATSVSAPDYFSEGLGPTLLTNVECSGTETELLDCTRDTDTRGFTCDTAGVVCQGTPIPVPLVVYLS